MTTPAPSNFVLLLDLAKETSSEKRRELLRQITDVFLADPPERSDKETLLFDEIVHAVAADLETQVRIELSKKVASSNVMVHRTARRLAMDEIEVARPVLEGAKQLSEADMLEVIEHKSQDHMAALAKHPNINTTVSSYLVDKGEDRVIVSLLENRTAQIDRQTYEKVADRAQTSPVLHAPFVKNQNVPLDLLNTVYLKVENDLRREIMRKFHGVSPAELEAALESSRNRLSAAYGALPSDFQVAKDFVAALDKKGSLKPPMLVQLLRENRRTAFLVAFAQLVDIEFDLGRRLVDGKDADALAMLCRGAGFDRGLFVTICLLVAGDGNGIGKAEQFGQLYEQVPVAAAQRALRFWKVRSKSGGGATQAA
ncbi:MAG TPA: DUF2336 domain-containing protein [Hyphomonadaceae bacterium]|nr:DUF2336 domain-containing protein [Hyphomonadaceae bacterium]